MASVRSTSVFSAGSSQVSRYERKPRAKPSEAATLALSTAAAVSYPACCRTPASVGLESSSSGCVLLYPVCEARRPVMIATKLPRVLGQ